MKSAIKAAAGVDLSVPGLEDAFRVISRAIMKNGMSLEKLTISKTTDGEGSTLTLHGNVEPIIKNRPENIYSETLRFVQGFCDSLSKRNPEIVAGVDLKNLGIIENEGSVTGSVTRKSVDEPGSSHKKMPFEIIVRMRRGAES